MVAMPAPVTVWAVELGPNSALEEVKGSLSLTSDALVFTPRDETRAPERFPFAQISRARRLRGSPVLMVVRGHSDGDRRFAFYFVQPPALERPEPIAQRPTPFGIGRNTKRKVRRQNVSYLGMWNQEKKALLREWERQVRTAIGAAR
jgi:hypothetical protein